MVYVTVDVSGFDDLDRQLAALERGPSEAEYRHALLKGGEIIAAEERRLAPRRTGRLAGSIVTTMTPQNLEADGQTVFIGPSYPNGRDGAYVEFGTSHSAAEPFVRPAVDAVGEQAGEVVVTDLADALARKTA